MGTLLSSLIIKGGLVYDGADYLNVTGIRSISTNVVYLSGLELVIGAFMPESLGANAGDLSFEGAYNKVGTC